MAAMRGTIKGYIAFTFYTPFDGTSLTSRKFSSTSPRKRKERVKFLYVEGRLQGQTRLISDPIDFRYIADRRRRYHRSAATRIYAAWDWV